ncbi:MAG: ABC transporter permease [Candidatus Hydrogenedentes bacterium]|nr:ABC transporter permease [Candidatus Hydrogenedentota bacterium]
MRVLTKKMFRTMVKTRGQTLAVCAVVLCGTACYICLASLYRDLTLTRDTYYAQNNFADFEIMLERAPVTALLKLESLPGVRKVRGRIVEEVKVDLPGVEETRTGRVVSMPEYSSGTINNIVIERGRYFEPGALDEVVVSKGFADSNDLEPGSTLRLTIDGKRHVLRVVGIGLSPEYVYVIRNIQELIPNPERFGIFWVPEEFAEYALSMNAACNNIVGLVDNREELGRILDQAETLLDSYGIFAKIERDDQVSNTFLSEEIKGLAASARILPTVFLGISALVIMVLLNRMVRNERTQIGLLKAYGYTDAAILWHYLQFGLILSLVGSVGGFLLGQWLAGQMMKIYVQFYQFPILRTRIYPDVVLTAILISVSFSLFGAVFAALRAARIGPADAMRPPAPRRAGHILLERFTRLWARFTFTWKMILRNVSRNKFRAGLNVFGVMVSCGLLIIGMFAIDGIQYALYFQFELSQKEDAKIVFYSERGRDALYEAARIPHVDLAEPVLQYPFEMRNGPLAKDIVVIGLPRDCQLQRLLDTHADPVDVGESGLVLTETLASDLDVEIGDVLRVKPLMGRIVKEKDVIVSKIVKQYFGTAAYMNIEALSRVLDEPFAMNAALIRMEPGTVRGLDKSVEDMPRVAFVQYREDAYDSIKATLGESMWIMNMMTIVFAGVISFSIIYNVTAVSLAERERELASLRVLGFSTKEVSRILFNENFLMAGIGVILGIPFGMGVCWLMVDAYATDLYRLPYYFENRTFVISIAITMVFVFMANFAVRRKLHNLDLVEVLKARE